MDLKLLSNFFLQQKEFIDNDPQAGRLLSYGLVFKNYENTYIRFAHWVTPEELKGKKVLDIGCRSAAAGAYALYHGASRYVGVDNDYSIVKVAKFNLNKYYANKNFEVIYEDAEVFATNLKERFDILFLGRILHYISNPESFLRTLSKKIKSIIVIEEGHPPAFILDYLLQNTSLSEQDKNHIINYIEFEFSFLEYDYFEKFFENFNNFPHNKIISNTYDFKGMGYSIGFLKKLLNGENFKENYEMYDSIKKYFPDEYGYGLYEKKDGSKKYIVRFLRQQQ